MAPVRNGSVLFNEYPTGLEHPVPGKTTVYDGSKTIDLDTEPLNGGVLVKVLVASIEPFLRRGMIKTGASHIQSYTIGQPISGFCVAKVLRTENSAFKVGDHLLGFIPFQEYSVLHQTAGLTVLDNKEGLPWSVYTGIAGMPGHTAYSGWKEFAKPQKGDVVFVSSGSGPVGSLVIQLAKAEGLKVIASAGTDEKCAFVKSIGADVVFNYKTTKTADVLAKEGPLNIYWDNVGGETLDAALEHAARHARFIECGMITALGGRPAPVHNLVHVVPKELALRGFVVTTLFPQYARAFDADVPRRIASGELKYLEDVRTGLQEVGQALLDVLQGRNVGKIVVVVAED